MFTDRVDVDIVNNILRQKGATRIKTFHAYVNIVTFVLGKDFEVQYELDEMRFEEDSLKASIKSILGKCCRQHSHEVVEIVLDPKTGEPVLEPGTNKQITRSYTVKDGTISLAYTGSNCVPEPLTICSRTLSCGIGSR